MGDSLARYKVFETKNFLQNVREIAPQRFAPLEQKLRLFVYPQLREEPHFGPQIKKLRDWQPPTWRYRIGDWRFFYQINEKEKLVFMTAAHHRKEAYR